MYALLEALESRRLLAGHGPGVWIADSTLFIQGTRGDDKIEAWGVRSDDGTNSVNVQLNGEYFPAQGRFERIVIRTLAGNDRVDLKDMNTVPCTAYLGAGDDVLRGSWHDDLVFAGSGNDSVSGEGGNDWLFGQAGHDQLHGDDGDDVLLGQAGNDALYGDAGRDTLFGHDGADYFFAQDGEGDLLFGGAGRDTADTEGELDYLHQRSVEAATVMFSWDFNNGQQGWEADFSDYQEGISQQMHGQWTAGIAALPEELGDGEGYIHSGANNSDDMFMFMRRHIEASSGLVGNRTYAITVEVVFASDAPSNALGWGGPPGEGVGVKIGVGVEKPEVIHAGRQDPHDHVVLSVRKDGGPGSYTTDAGNIANGRSPDQPREYVSLHRSVSLHHTIRVGGDGSAWLIVGTDSGTEGRTTVYYQSIRFTFQPI